MRQDKTRINQQIREREVRLIDSEENHIGVVTIEKALEMAQEAGVDLVEVATTSRPHVCRVMDYGKYKYEQKRRTKEARKKQHTISVKEVKFRPKISTHDYDFKMRNAEKFLSHGDKVKIVMMFRGREMAHADIGRDMLKKIADDLAEVGTVEAWPKFEGRTLVMVMTPNSTPQPAPKKKSKDEDSPKESKPKAENQESQKSETDDAKDENA